MEKIDRPNEIFFFDFPEILGEIFVFWPIFVVGPYLPTKQLSKVPLNARQGVSVVLIGSQCEQINSCKNLSLQTNFLGFLMRFFDDFGLQAVILVVVTANLKTKNRAIGSGKLVWRLIFAQETRFRRAKLLEKTAWKKVKSEDRKAMFRFAARPRAFLPIQHQKNRKIEILTQHIEFET